MSAPARNIDTSKIARYVWNGQKDRYWYEQTKADFERVLPTKDINLICDLFAATSPNNTLKANVVQALKALYQYEHGEKFQGYTPNVIAQLELVRNGLPLTGRKIYNFSQAIKGDKNAVVVDTWICRAFGISTMKEKYSPTKRIYDFIEKYIQTEAVAMGLQPREMCSMIWGGIRTEMTGRLNSTRFTHVLSSKIVVSLFKENVQTKKGFYVG